MMKSLVLACMAGMLLAGPLAADPAHAQATPGVDDRERRQAARIEAGVRDGSLSRRETARLVGGQIGVRATERRFKSDGRVTIGERVRLHRRLSVQNRRIFRARHN